MPFLSVFKAFFALGTRQRRPVAVQQHNQGNGKFLGAFHWCIDGGSFVIVRENEGWW